VHASARYAQALSRLLISVDEALGRPARLDLVDIGAGCGSLLTQIRSCVPAELARRIVPTAVEVSARPSELPKEIGWIPEPPEEITGLVVANEWLDNVPLDVVELTPSGPRLILVDPRTGAERLGSAPSPQDCAWLDRWWPLLEPGDRAEVGRTRSAAWASVISRLRRGAALAVDYAHVRSERPVCGTLTGYRDGHVVPVIPDGSCDVTAHVALDACACAGTDAGATATLLTTQRAALRALGLTGSRPPIELAHRAPLDYVTALCAAGEEAELIDPTGLGGFGWLLQSVGIPIPTSIVPR
jgi:SAM-dependent MidA family methyltransferase